MSTMKVHFPVWLSQNDKGLYCTIDGKFFFPDRKCKNTLTSGYAIITKKTDKGTYGFFEAEMKKYPRFTIDGIRRIVNNDSLYRHPDILRYYKDTCIGDAIVCNRRVFVMGDNGVPDILSIDDEYLRKHYTPEEFTWADYICNDEYQMNFDELSGMFTPFEFLCMPDRADKYISNLFDSAVDFGFVRLMSIRGVLFAEIDTDFLIEAIEYYSEEEMREIADAFTSINNKASKSIKSMAKKGRISVKRFSTSGKFYIH